MVVVVSDPRLVAGDGAGGLNPPNQTDGGQGGEHVIDRLPRYLGQVGAHRPEDRLGVGVRMGVHRLQHRHPRARHAKVSCTQLIRVIRCRGHSTNNAPFLESVKSFGEDFCRTGQRTPLRSGRSKNRVDLMAPAA